MESQEMGLPIMTGAYSEIGAIYADRLAKRGHLVARNREHMAALAKKLVAEPRLALLPNLSRRDPAARYGIVCKAG